MVGSESYSYDDLMHTAFLLAAGFGSRLRPLTERLPKPLVPVCGVPMLDYVLAHCAFFGLQRVVVNAHYKPERIEEWAREQPSSVSVTVSIERPDILGTGGGLKHVASILGEQVVVLNGDVLCDVDLGALQSAIPVGGAAMVLRAHQRDATDKYGIVATDQEDRVIDLKKMAVTDPVGTTRWDSHFTGIHGLDRRVLDRVPSGFGCIVRTAYLELVPERTLVAVRHEGVWLDVGDPHAYLETNLAVLRGQVVLHLDPMQRAEWWTRGGESHPVWATDMAGAVWLGKAISLGENVRLEDVVVGDGATIPEGSELNECIVWAGATVPAGKWSRCIFYDNEFLEIGYSHS